MATPVAPSHLGHGALFLCTHSFQKTEKRRDTQPVPRSEQNSPYSEVVVTTLTMLRIFVELLLIWQWLGAFTGSLARSPLGLADRAALYTDQVSFDSYSLNILGQRIFLQ